MFMSISNRPVLSPMLTFYGLGDKGLAAAFPPGRNHQLTSFENVAKHPSTFLALDVSPSPFTCLLFSSDTTSTLKRSLLLRARLVLVGSHHSNPHPQSDPSIELVTCPTFDPPYKEEYHDKPKKERVFPTPY